MKLMMGGVDLQWWVAPFDEFDAYDLTSPWYADGVTYAADGRNLIALDGAPSWPIRVNPKRVPDVAKYLEHPETEGALAPAFFDAPKERLRIVEQLPNVRFWVGVEVLWFAFDGGRGVVTCCHRGRVGQVANRT
ncbi:hypothetical protein [Botrimarina mediterranea]|uniref:hypothetical protein n=1 Tax=Botrimarina mediterranea TaxID=2528022 RepID=UPI00118C7D42|nr:hypothetical protein K2D_16440 [Planctomycetes bacterium K2D]